MRRMNGRAMHWAESERDHAVWGARNIANATPRRVESGRTMATVLGSRRAEGGYVHNVADDASYGRTEEGGGGGLGESIILGFLVGVWTKHPPQIPHK